MNPIPSSRYSLSLFAAVLFAGCASSPMSRIDANRAAYESWPIDVQEAVLNGEAKKGMTPEQVRVAMGQPSEVTSRGNGDEIWIYRSGGGLGGTSSVLRNTGISLGTGIGGVGVSTGMGGGGRRQTSGDEKEVVFENGVVLRAD